MSPEILVCGLATVDFVFEVDAFPDRPEKYAAHGAHIVGGGCAATAAVAIQRLGGRARLAARMGQDLIGDLISAELEAEGVDLSPVDRRKGGKSPFSAIHIDRSGERQITAFRGARLAEIVAGDLGRPAGVLADTRWPKAAAQVLAHAKALGVPGVLDGEAPVPKDLVGLASHVAFSAQGLAAFAGTSDLAGGLARVRAQTDAWVAVTDGPNGTFIAAGGGAPRHVPAPKIEAVDTLGAGDVWHGALTLALAEGKEVVQAVAFANAAASIKCTRPGGRAGAPTRAEVEAFMGQTTC